MPSTIVFTITTAYCILHLAFCISTVEVVITDYKSISADNEKMETEETEETAIREA